MPTIEIKAITKRINDKTLLDNVSFVVPDKKSIYIIGPSGAGKTTLLNIIAGLDDAYDGDILFDGVNVNNKKPFERNIAMIFQETGLFPHTKVKHNISYGLKKLMVSQNKIDEAVIEVAKALQIEKLLDRYPASLSAGEKQRVGIARALVRKPSILLLDEPFANLDERLKENLQDELNMIQKRDGITMIQVTHDQREALKMADMVLLLNEGKLVAYGTPDELMKETGDTFTNHFLGKHI